MLFVRREKGERIDRCQTKGGHKRICPSFFEVFCWILFLCHFRFPLLLILRPRLCGSTGWLKNGLVRVGRGEGSGGERMGSL